MKTRLGIISFLFLIYFSCFANTTETTKGDGCFLRQCNKRDSVLIADQLDYGVVLNNINQGVKLVPLDLADSFQRAKIVNNWKLDTLSVKKTKQGKVYNIEAYLKITSFDSGRVNLPPLKIVKIEDKKIDTLCFAPRSIDVKTMPVDTATFKPFDIKSQITYPIQFKEVLPFIIIGFIVLIILSVIFFLVYIFVKKKKYIEEHQDPPHIIALRQLDKFRNSKYWEVEKQKMFYSGVCDALREYISNRYGFGAMEMTSGEILSRIKKEGLSPELYDDLENLLITSDGVKFAKQIVSDDVNAKVVPTAVYFVTETYKKDLDQEVQENTIKK